MGRLNAINVQLELEGSQSFQNVSGNNHMIREAITTWLSDSAFIIFYGAVLLLQSDHKLTS